MKMEATDRLGYCLAFGLISHAIDNKRTKLNKTAEIYVEDVKNLFSEVVDGLESVLNPSKGYHFVENLKELVETNNGRWKNASESDLECMIMRFESGINYLERWLKDPQKFYEENSKEAEELSTLCNKLKKWRYTENEAKTCI